MNQRSMLKWILILSVALSWSFGFEALAEVRLQSSISSRQLVIGDQGYIQIQLEDADLSAQLKLPNVPGLTLQQAGPPSQSSRTMWVNGTKTSHNSLVFQIAISAEKPGTFRIPPIEVLYQGEVYPTPAYQVQAAQGNSAGAMSLQIKTNKQKIYIGEPLTIQVTWNVLKTIEDYKFRFPLLADKDNLKLRLVPYPPTATTTDLQIDQYRVAFFPTALPDGGTQYQTQFQIFPHQPGALKIPAAHIKAMIPKGYTQQRDFFGRLVQRPNLVAAYTSSKALSIPILPLPTSGKPVDFSGAVGQFKLEVQAKGNQFEVGEPIELSLKISGKGSFDNIERPSLAPLSPGFKATESLAPGQLGEQEITFTQTIKATRANLKNIPAVSLSYFDPKTGQYTRAFSKPIPVQVKPAQTLKLSEISGAEPQAEGPEPLGNEFLSEEEPWMSLPSWSWALALVGVTLLFEVYSRRKTKAPTSSIEAAPWGLKEIAELEQQQEEGGLNQLLQITEDLLDWRFGPKRRWSKVELQELQQAQLISPELFQSLEGLLHHAQARLYGGESNDPNYMADAVGVLKAIYPQLSQRPTQPT